jgi:hypothetical protein
MTLHPFTSISRRRRTGERRHFYGSVTHRLTGVRPHTIREEMLLMTDLLQLLNNHELYPIFARRSQPNAPGSRAGDTGDRGRISQRLSDESLARVLKEHLCRTGRFRIQRDPTIPNRDSGVLR